MGEDGFEGWLAEKLDALSLDSEVFVDYVSGILGDEGEPLEERVDAVCELLADATEEDLGDFKPTLQARWEMHVGQEEAAKERAKVAMQLDMEKKKEEERRQVAEAEEERKVKAMKGAQRSEEEKRARELILSQYGYDSDPVDEDGNPLDVEEAEGAEGAAAVRHKSEDELLERPSNKERVLEQNHAKREAQKKTHSEKVLKDKLDLERDKMKKDMAKNARKTQKGERRSGRG